MDTGKIIILNGTSSSGKTSLLTAIQDRMEEPFLNMGIDQFIFAMPKRYLDRPLWDDVLGLADRGGETGQRLFSAMHHAVLAAARSGMNVIADHVLVEEGWLLECASLFRDLPAWLVGVRCPLDVLEQRESARRNRTPGQARQQFERVHVPGVYDFEVDTSIFSVRECAELVVQYILSGNAPHAFQRIYQESLRPKNQNT